MIHVASLAGIAQAALPGQTMATSVPRICSKISLDPSVSEMDVVLLGPEDAKGNASRINTALTQKHPGVCVIYMYVKAQDADRLDVENKFQCKKIKESTIKEAIDRYVTDHIEATGRTYVSSDEFVTLNPDDELEIEEEPALEEDFDLVESNTEEIPQNLAQEQDSSTPELEPEPEPYHMNVTPMDNSQYTNVPEQPLQSKAFVPTQDMSDANTNNMPELPTKIEDRLNKVTNVEDWAIYKENLHKDAINKRLIEENTEYVGLINYLDVLDEKIRTVWRDTTLNASEKFEKIKEIGLQRSVQRAAVNSINVEKAISIITTITASAARTVEEKLDSIDTALYKITTDKEAIMDTSEIDAAISRRADVQLELLELCRSIVDLYKAMDDLVDEELQSLDENLPSSNAFINETVKPLGTAIFTPTNTAALTKRILQAIQANRITVSQLEAKVRDFINLMFKICETSEEIVQAEQNMINQLRANRVEDVVIVDSLLKECLRLYIGGRNSGVHATAITWSGICSRSQNMLLIDISGHSKFTEYGIEAMSLTDFLNSRIEKEFMCVDAGKKLTPQELQDMLVEVKSRLNFYPYVNIILDESDAEGLEQLSADARVIHYITNCTADSIERIRKIYKYPTVNNIGRKIVTIGAPISPMSICDKAEIDYTSAQLIPLPNLPQILACELSNDRPYEYEDVKAAFKEAFR